MIMEMIVGVMTMVTMTIDNNAEANPPHYCLQLVTDMKIGGFRKFYLRDSEVELLDSIPILRGETRFMITL